MKQLRLVALVCGGALAAAAGLQAQNPTGPAIKKRVVPAEKYQEMLAQNTKPVSAAEETLRHGDLLSLNRADGSRLTGTLVYQDARAGRLVVRPAAGAAPVAVSMKDVEEIERIVPASTAGGDKGGVKFASDEGARRAPSYEIEVQEIFNGPTRSVRYFGKPLSPAETEQLAELERAANQQAEAMAQVQALNDQIARANAARDDRTTTAGGTGFAFSSYSTAFPTNNGLFQTSPFAPGIYNAPVTAALPAIIAAGAATRSTPAIIPGGAAEGDNSGELMKSLRDAEANLAKARQTYTAARDRAVFDTNGRIVAVRLEQK